MQLWCPTSKVLLVLPCSREEYIYDKLLKYDSMNLWCPTTKVLLFLPCSQSEYDELLKYEVVVPNY